MMLVALQEAAMRWQFKRARSISQHIAARMDQGLWQYVLPEAAYRYVRHFRMAYPFRHLPIAVDDSRVIESFTAYNTQPQDEHLIWYKQPLVFEPTYGFALTDSFRLLLQSMPYYERVGLPAFLPYIWRRFVQRQPVRHERCVISLREFGDDNYYHFYSDVVGRLALLERWPISKEIPILISQRLFDKPYFQQALQRSTLGQRRWIVHSRGFIQADEAILCKVMPHSRQTFDYMRQTLNSPSPDPYATRRVLLTRQSKRGRYLVNQDEIACVCAEFGFEQVDTDQLDLAEQMNCFATARYVVGIHGAGLVNLIFRAGAPLSLLELFPVDGIPPHYFWICQHYGFEYDALVGTSTIADGSFMIDPQQLRTKLANMLK